MSRSFWTFVCGQVRGFCRGVCRLCRSVAGHAADVGHALGAEVGADHLVADLEGARCVKAALEVGDPEPAGVVLLGEGVALAQEVAAGGLCGAPSKPVDAVFAVQVVGTEGHAGAHLPRTGDVDAGDVLAHAVPAGLAGEDVAFFGRAVLECEGVVDLGDFTVDVVAAEVAPLTGVVAETEGEAGVGLRQGERDAEDALVAPLLGGDVGAHGERGVAVGGRVQLGDVGVALGLEDVVGEDVAGVEGPDEVGGGASAGELVEADVAELTVELPTALFGPGTGTVAFTGLGGPFGLGGDRDCAGLGVGLGQRGVGRRRPAHAQHLHHGETHDGAADVDDGEVPLAHGGSGPGSGDHTTASAPIMGALHLDTPERPVKLRPLTFLVLAGTLGCTTRFAAPGPEPEEDPNEAWADVLAQAATPEGVDYTVLADNQDVMDAFLSWVAVHGPNADDLSEGKEDKRMSIMANAYNASVLRAVMHHEVQASVREVGGGLWALRPGSKFFWGQKFRVNGEYQSLYFLEHQDIIGRYQEPLVHITLNCASRGCPPLRYWRDEKMISQMKRALRDWLKTDDAMRLDPGGQGYQLNEIFYWYADDFTDWSDAVTVCDYLSTYASGDRRNWLEAHAEDCPVNPLPYDWSLDATATPWERSEDG